MQCDNLKDWKWLLKLLTHLQLLQIAEQQKRLRWFQNGNKNVTLNDSKSISFTLLQDYARIAHENDGGLSVGDVCPSAQTGNLPFKQIIYVALGWGKDVPKDEQVYLSRLQSCQSPFYMHSSHIYTQ